MDLVSLCCWVKRKKKKKIITNNVIVPYWLLFWYCDCFIIIIMDIQYYNHGHCLLCLLLPLWNCPFGLLLIQYPRESWFGCSEGSLSSSSLCRSYSMWLSVLLVQRRHYHPIVRLVLYVGVIVVGSVSLLSWWFSFQCKNSHQSSIINHHYHHQPLHNRIRFCVRWCGGVCSRNFVVAACYCCCCCCC